MYARSRSASGRWSGCPCGGAGSAHRRGEILHVDLEAGRDGTRALDRVLQLPNVAGPEIVEQALQRARRVADDRPAETRRRLGQEITRERQELFRSLAQGRHVQIDHAQPVIQVAPKPLLRDFLERGPGSWPR